VIVKAEFSAEPSAPGAARRLVVNALRERGHGETMLDDIAIVVSELATNAVLHARSPFSIAATERDFVVRLSVHDHGEGSPRVPDRGPAATSGRGLMLVDQLANRWGVDANLAGKIVWAELRPKPGSSSYL
jgi:serine/threonine-protein kinase RsbW